MTDAVGLFFTFSVLGHLQVYKDLGLTVGLMSRDIEILHNLEIILGREVRSGLINPDLV